MKIDAFLDFIAVPTAETPLDRIIMRFIVAVIFACTSFAFSDLLHSKTIVFMAGYAWGAGVIYATMRKHVQ